MTFCVVCRQPLTAKHDHPHDHVGPLTAPCLACNKVHRNLTPA